MRDCVRTSLVALVVAIGLFGGWLAIASEQDAPVLGQPRAELSSTDLAAFDEGKRRFMEKLPGVGPLFNDERCADCHFAPSQGGSGNLEHVAIVGPAANEFEAYRRHALPGWTIPKVPPNASRRVAPALYGLGLVEQIPDDTIRAACATSGGHVDSAKQQGSLPRNEVARFGMKPFVGTVKDFVDGALTSESGVTTVFEHNTDDDQFPDPEADQALVDNLAAYIRGLRPAPRDGTDAAGENAFRSLGCARCHVPDMAPAVGVYSDFCLHRMGDGLADGIFDHEAKGDEFRSTPLWGLRFRSFYLHDGRATTLHDAITAHGGQATDAVNAYRSASEEQRAALLRFLKTL
jgi:CxxC motif-containing protein (DUF1111 family)